MFPLKGGEALVPFRVLVLIFAICSAYVGSMRGVVFHVADFMALVWLMPLHCLSHLMNRAKPLSDLSLSPCLGRDVVMEVARHNIRGK